MLNGGLVLILPVSVPSPCVCHRKCSVRRLPYLDLPKIETSRLYGELGLRGRRLSPPRNTTLFTPPLVLMRRLPVVGSVHRRIAHRHRLTLPGLGAAAFRQRPGER